MGKEFLPILAKGEEYIEVEKPRNGAPTDESKLPKFQDAKENLIQQIDTTRSLIKNIPDELRVSDIILSMDLLPGYYAKSYYPTNLLRYSGVQDVGSKNTPVRIKDEKNKEHFTMVKTVFIRASDDELEYFSDYLKSSSEYKKGFISDLRRIEKFTIPNNSNIIERFPETWDFGRVEFILHPFGETEPEVIEKFFTLMKGMDVEISKVKYKSYYPGPTFFSVKCAREQLIKLLKYNPIRAAHPLEFRAMQNFSRTLSTFSLPKPSEGNIKSKIIVGMFDGGVDDSNSLLKGYVIEKDPIGSLSIDDYLEHGTAVAGTLLYGNLQKYSDKDVLPIPAVIVDSYRVLPPSDPMDIDLYEAIDVIEEIVPKRPDIKVYNLSMGPYGPIEDEVSRFTYALDSLSGEGERLFCVAVGNDGDLPDEQSRRIQAPSDTVNGLGVGAFTWGEKDNIERAPYSCIGEGREGCKIKPDIVAFGGSSKHPFHLVGMKGGRKLLSQGTSFSTPLVTSKVAELIGRCNVADPLVARALIVHSAKHPDSIHDKYLGYGAIPDSLEEILGCEENRVTILYKQRMLPTRFAKVPIPFIGNIQNSSSVEISWTIAIATKLNPNHTGDYTNHCIEDTFYPSAYRYEFQSPDKKRKVLRNLILDKEEINQLVSEGWIQSKNPKSESGNQYQTEDERRANFKWDTIAKKSKTMRWSSLESPYIVLHAMERNNPQDMEFINYAIAVTVHYKKYAGNAYEETVKQYSKLEASRISSINDIMVKVAR